MEKHCIPSEVLEKHCIPSGVMEKYCVPSEVLEKHCIPPEVLGKTLYSIPTKIQPNTQIQENTVFSLSSGQTLYSL